MGDLRPPSNAWKRGRGVTHTYIQHQHVNVDEALHRHGALLIGHESGGGLEWMVGSLLEGW